jgi:hypothetical protein
MLTALVAMVLYVMVLQVKLHNQSVELKWRENVISILKKKA